MSTNVNGDVLLQLLDRMPAVAWANRVTPTTGAIEWLYFNPRMAELYGVLASALQSDPMLLAERIVPEDRARLERQIAVSLETLAPLLWIGRITHSSGEVRWLEFHSTHERDAEGRIIAYGNTSDVTDRQRAQEALAAGVAAREASDLLYRSVIDALPVGVVVLDSIGEFVIINPAVERMMGVRPTGSTMDASKVEEYGAFEADGTTPLNMNELPLMRALRGEVQYAETEVVFRNHFLASEARLKHTAVPLRDAAGNLAGALSVSQNITAQRALEQELRARNEQLAASEEAKNTLIERLRYSIDELSNPILEVWDDVLVMPIIGVIDSRRTADMVQRLLTEVVRAQASFVIVDLTGVEVVDTQTADHLMRLMRKVEIVGARCVLTGIRPAVADTLVEIGVDFGRITTLRNLKHGLREAMRTARSEREHEGSRDLDIDDDPAESSAARRRGE
jgi:rsbT co-antagonist protein RsbR